MSKKLVCVALVAFVGLSGGSAAKAQSGKVSFMPAPYASGLSYVDRTGKVTPVPRRPAGITYTPAPVKTCPHGKPTGLAYVNIFSDVTTPVPRRPAGVTYTPAPATKYPYGKPQGLSYVSMFSDVQIPVPRRPGMPPTSTATKTQPRPGTTLSPWTTKHR
jgi:hypothetical protein